MSEVTTTPATLVQKMDWTMLSINKNTFQGTDETIHTTHTSTVTHAVHKFLGDSKGVPQLVVSLGNNMGTRFIEATQITEPEFFGEIITRADGSKMTILALIDEKLSQAIKPASNPDGGK